MLSKKLICGSDPWMYWFLESCSIEAVRWWDIWNTCRWCNTLQLDLQLSLVYRYMVSYTRCKVLKNGRVVGTYLAGLFAMYCLNPICQRCGYKVSSRKLGRRMPYSRIPFIHVLKYFSDTCKCISPPTVVSCFFIVKK